MKEKDVPDNSSVNIDLIRGHMDTIILRTLSDGDKYGYEILSEISDKSEGLYSLKQPTLYSCLKRLEKQGLVTSYKGDLSYGAQRVYYSLTDMGRQFLENDQIQWEFSRTIINNLLSDKDYDPEKSPKPFDVSSFRPLTRRQRGDANYYATVDPAKLPEEAPDEFAPAYGQTVYSENAGAAPVEGIKSEEPNIAPEPYADISEDEDISPVADEIYSEEEYPAPDFPAPVADDLAEELPAGDIPSEDIPEVSNEQNDEEPAAPVIPPAYVREHDEEQRRRAADVLYGAPPVEDEPEQPLTDEKPQERPVKRKSARDNNYIESFGRLYDRSVEESVAPVLAQEEQKAVSADPLTLNQVRELFYTQGYILKPYSKATNAGYYVNKYFYVNRLLRDNMFIVYAVFLAQLLICALAGGISWAAFGLAAGISLLAPVFMFIIFAIDPDKRKRAVFSLKSALINCIAFCICYMALVFILGFFVFGVRADMGETWIKPIVIPLVFMLDAPIALLIYAKLYSSKKYHIN